MQERNALDIALELYRQPTLARKVRRDGLPPSVLSVIKIAAGSEEELEMPAGHSPGETREIREAAIFFLQNCLFQPGGDNYRVLGVEPDATIDQMRLHKRWLLKWLHPDLNRNTWEAAYLQRVLAAWREITGSISTPEFTPSLAGLKQAPRRGPPRYYRLRFPNHYAARFKPRRILRKSAIIFALSFAVFLVFRQSHGAALASFFQNLIYPIGT